MISPLISPSATSLLWPEVEVYLSASKEDQQMLALVYDMATLAHQGQVRRGGNPYILHPIMVAGRLTDLIDKAVGMGHDMVEADAANPVAPWQLFQSGLPWEVVDGILTLTRLSDESYPSFIARIKRHRNGRWSGVKRADLLANLADDPTPQQRIKCITALQALGT